MRAPDNDAVGERVRRWILNSGITEGADQKWCAPAMEATVRVRASVVIAVIGFASATVSPEEVQARRRHHHHARLSPIHYSESAGYSQYASRIRPQMRLMGFGMVPTAGPASSEARGLRHGAAGGSGSI